MGSIWNLLKINFFGNLAGIFSLVRGRLRIRTASVRIFSLVLRCVESYPRCFITLPALQSIYLPLLQDHLSNGSKRHYQSGKHLPFEQRLASFWRIFLKDWLDCSTIARSVLPQEQYFNRIIIWIGKVFTNMQIRGSSNVFNLKSAIWSTMRPRGGRGKVKGWNGAGLRHTIRMIWTL